MLFTAICNVQSWENALPVDTAARNCTQSYHKRNKCFPFFCWRKSHPLLLGISTWEKDVTDGNGICKATNKERQQESFLNKSLVAFTLLIKAGHHFLPSSKKAEVLRVCTQVVQVAQNKHWDVAPAY